MQRNNPNDDAEVTFERSSGNVFADLELENSDELLVKADLADAVMSVVRDEGWTQSEAADRTGLTQPEVSLLGRMKFDRFSQERLQTVLRRLGMNVDLLHPREWRDWNAESAQVGLGPRPIGRVGQILCRRRNQPRRLQQRE